MTGHALSIEGLEKIYRGGRREPAVHALKPLDLTVKEGEIFGLLGPNGAGKTTLVKLILGIVFPSAGTGSVFEHAIGDVKAKSIIGYLPENHRYPAYLTGDGVLSYFGRLSGIAPDILRKKSDELLDLVNMTKWRSTRIRKYSKGMMQRIGLAQALINEPRVLFLDEPTDGVDPVGRKEIREIILRLQAAGTTIFLNSHLLSEVEMICSRVAILSKGRVVRSGTVAELTQGDRHYRLEVAPESAERLPATIERFNPISVSGQTVQFQAADLAELNQILDELRRDGILIASVAPVRQSLEELFIDVITEEAE